MRYHLGFIFTGMDPGNMPWARWSDRRLYLQLPDRFPGRNHAWRTDFKCDLRMCDMSPEFIVEQAFSLGVILYLENGNLKSSGKLPPDWIQRASSWLPYRDQVIQWLADNPSHQHRVRMAKVLVANIKRRKNLPCIHLGQMLEKKPACGCGARHECGLHGSCVLTGNTDRWRICSRCPDYSPAEST